MFIGKHFEKSLDEVLVADLPLLVDPVQTRTQPSSDRR